MKRLAFFLFGLILGVSALAATMNTRQYTTQQAVNILAQGGGATDQFCVPILSGDTDLDQTHYVGGYTGDWAVYAEGDSACFLFHEYGGSWTTTYISGTFHVNDGEWADGSLVIDSVRVVRPSSTVYATMKGARYDG